MVVDGAIQRKRGAHGHFDGTFVQDGESAGQAEAHRADVGIWRVAEAGRAPAENFCPYEELDVDFEADDGLVFASTSGAIEVASGVDFAIRDKDYSISLKSAQARETQERGVLSGIAAKEKKGVSGVAASVFQKREAGGVASEEAGNSMGKAGEELPDGEVGGEEKLDGAEERGERDAGDGAAVAEPEADGDVDEEAGIDNGDEFVEANENVAKEKSEQREEKGEATVF